MTTKTKEAFNTKRIQFHEEMVKSYKEMLTEVFKDKETQYADWYKDLLRWGKSHHASELKSIIKEQQHLRQGLNPPWTYPDYKKE